MRDIQHEAARTVPPEEMGAEIERLSGLSVKELKAAWAAEFRRDPPRGLWPDRLLRTLTWRLQEKAFGGHDKATLELLEAHGRERAGDRRVRRLKPGTVLVRDFGGVRHTVTIVPNGFAWRENLDPSLTAIARIITGANWNGPRFFGLRKNKGESGGNAQESAA